MPQGNNIRSTLFQEKLYPGVQPHPNWGIKIVEHVTTEHLYRLEIKCTIEKGD